jgi:hypothetical protein
VNTPAGKLIMPNAGVMNIVDKKVPIDVILLPEGPAPLHVTVFVVKISGLLVL